MLVSCTVRIMPAGSIPTSAPLASPAVRSGTSSDGWNDADLAKLNAASPAHPVVDDLILEVPGPDPPRVAFSDLETVEIAGPHRRDWGQWGGLCYEIKQTYLNSWSFF